MERLTHYQMEIRVFVAEDVPGTVDVLFRREWGRLVSLLARRFGPENLQLAEDVVQEALLAALRNWSYRGIPENPTAWLLQVAKNRALDRFRSAGAEQRAAIESLRSSHQESLRGPLDDLPDEDDIRDDQLRMMFMCCHPAISPESQVALTLKTLCGFSVEEIAHGLRGAPASVAQRLTRARNALRGSGVQLELPETCALSERLDAVCMALYLLFNEGYTAHSGADLVRLDLCEEALYLTTLLAGHPVGDKPEVHALLALMYLHASRLDARGDAAGNLLLLSEQDRSLWSARLIASGFRSLQSAQGGDTVTRYHLEAGIAACHAMAADYESTAWSQVAGYYDQLYERTLSPVVGLNRAVAIAMLYGPKAGLWAVEELKDHRALQGYYLLPATLGYLHGLNGDRDAAASAYRDALNCPCNEIERRFLAGRLEALSEPIR